MLAIRSRASDSDRRHTACPLAARPGRLSTPAAAPLTRPIA
ncbi:hypothetical protein C7S16_6972 [Burkholderia thailandensis]|uniref:Uncharacterized protein n=1 Tax=Burkholderia thailandensis TaxID=57975 RepID=A0AAW9CXZ7_BURTH|nr:hypothetical protein [Burkholderia thailandensis]MDW9252639.1 hypothetical protein [Burkholderia thailandensis]